MENKLRHNILTFLHKIEGKNLNCSYLGSQTTWQRALESTEYGCPKYACHKVSHADEMTMMSPSQPLSNF